MEKLSLLLVQTDIVWEDKQANLAKLSSLINKRRKHADMIILPEMFSTGFSMAPAALAEGMSGSTTQWMLEQAIIADSLVAGSIIIEEDGKYYNRFLAYSPDGLVAKYDKRHLFRMAGEENQYQPGGQRVVFEWRGWRVLALVCYDIRFPVWSRNRDDYDLVVYVANWPEPRRDVWLTLLKARALENQTFVAGVNRTGLDGNGLKYVGDSMLISPKGKLIGQMNDNEIGLIETDISLNELQLFRQKFPVHLDKDDFSII